MTPKQTFDTSTYYAVLTEIERGREQTARLLNRYGLDIVSQEQLDEVARYAADAARRVREEKA